MIKWENVSKEDYKTISKIVNRITGMYPTIDKMSANMDLSAAHATTPINLVKLLTSSDFDLLHDVAGIFDNLDRETGELKNCFVPRSCR